MRKKNEEEDVLKEETKNEIQELFDELFVNELNERVGDISTQNTESIDALKEIKKKVNNNNISICDKIDSLKEELKCIGSEDEWEDDTLFSFLSRLAPIISEIYNYTKQIGNDKNDVTLFNRIKDLNKEIELLQKFIQNSEKQIVEDEFKKVYKYSDNIIKLLQKIDEELEDINSELKEEKMASKEILRMIASNEELMKSEIMSLDDTISKKIDDIVFIGKKKFTYITAGMGVLIISNIAMLIMLLIK